MINSVGAGGSPQTQFRMELAAGNSKQPNARQAQPEAAPPPGKGLFADLDTDSSGGLSQSEFQKLAEGVAEVTGSSVDVGSLYTTYDADGNGVLSGPELRQAMAGMGVEPPPPPRAPGAVQNVGQSSVGGSEGLENQSAPESLPRQPGDPTGAPSQAPSQYQRYEDLMAYLRPAGERPRGLNVLT
jgi:hypothetical protein